MRVCEICGGMKCHPRTVNHQRIKILCPACHGTGMILLGHESATRYEQMQAEAMARAIREGWYEEVWEGEHPGPVQRVLRLVGRADLVACEPKDAA